VAHEKGPSHRDEPLALAVPPWFPRRRAGALAAGHVPPGKDYAPASANGGFRPSLLAAEGAVAPRPGFRSAAREGSSGRGSASPHTLRPCPGRLRSGQAGQDSLCGLARRTRLRHRLCAFFRCLRPSVAVSYQAVKRRPARAGAAALQASGGVRVPARLLYRRPLAPSQAVAAEDGPPFLGKEGHLRHLATGGASCRVHLAGPLAAEAGEGAVVHVALGQGAPAQAPAGRAARRFMQESATGVKGLLTGRENERRAALATDQKLIRIWHGRTPLFAGK